MTKFSLCVILVGLLGSSCSVFYQENRYIPASLPPVEAGPLASALASASPLSICVEAPTADHQRMLLTETKLSIAAWAAAIAPQTPAAVFQRFVFSSGRTCPGRSSGVDLIIAFPSRHLVLGYDFPSSLFNRATMSCTRTPQAACQLNDWNASILQLGSAERPARLIYSPHAIWLSLSEDLTNSDPALQEILRQTYQRLRSQKDPGVNELTSLISDLEGARLHSGADHNFHALRSAFMTGSMAELPEMSYSAELGIYPYLLRDIGFALGLHPQSEPGNRAYARPLFLSPKDAKFAQQTEAFALLTASQRITH